MYNKEERERIYKWREQNPEQYKEIQKRAVEKYRKKNKDVVKKANDNYYKTHREEILKKIKEKRRMAKEAKNNI